jgi:hypothetical protein
MQIPLLKREEKEKGDLYQQQQNVHDKNSAEK